MALSHRCPLIFNPKARSQRGRRAMRFLMEHANRLTLYATNHAGEARELAAKFAAAGEPVVIAAGGDGTVNEVVSGLAGSATALAVLPTGTMNVFAREIRLPFHNLAQCLDIIDRGFIREIDLFEANGAPFVQMAGVGVDARVIERTSWRSKKMLGPLAYLVAAAGVIRETPPQLEVEFADGSRETGVAVLTGNGALYGGQFRFFHHADNQDSMLDVLIYKKPGLRLLLDSLRGLSGRAIHAGSSTVSYRQTPGFTVRSAAPAPVEVDGELLGSFVDTRFAAAACRLRVVAPEHPAPAPSGGALVALSGMVLGSATRILNSP